MILRLTDVCDEATFELRHLREREQGVARVGLWRPWNVEIVLECAHAAGQPARADGLVMIMLIPKTDFSSFQESIGQGKTENLMDLRQALDFSRNERCPAPQQRRYVSHTSSCTPTVAQLVN